MNIQTMLIPHKHIRFSESLISVAGYVRKFLDQPRTVDELWTLLRQANHELIKPDFTQMVLGLDILFSLKQIISDDSGRIWCISDENTEAK